MTTWSSTSDGIRARSSRATWRRPERSSLGRGSIASNDRGPIASNDQAPGKYIAVIAHDGRKDELASFVHENVDFFRKRRLVATHNTGRMLEAKTGVTLASSVASGPLGGDQQIGAMIATGLVEAVLFFKDPLRPLPHQADVDALLRLCDVHRVMLGTNASTCAAIVAALARG